MRKLNKFLKNVLSKKKILNCKINFFLLLVAELLPEPLKNVQITPGQIIIGSSVRLQEKDQNTTGNNPSLSNTVQILDDNFCAFPIRVASNALQSQQQNQVEASPQKSSNKTYQKSPIKTNKKGSRRLTDSNQNPQTGSALSSPSNENPETSSTSSLKLNPILTVLPILVDEERSIVSELRSLDHNRSALVDQMSKIIEQLRETDEKRTPLMHLRELKQEVIMGNQSFQI